MDRIPRPGDLYRHFTNELYQVVTTAIHAETGEQLVVYQAMFADFSVFASPVAQFLSEVDGSKYPQAAQQYLFEKMEKTKSLENRIRQAQGNSADLRNEFNKQPDGSAIQIRDDRSGSSLQDMQPVPQAAVSPGREQRPRTQSPAESRRGLRQEPSEAAGADSYYYERRRRQIEEREQRRGLFRKPERHESATDELRANPCLLKFLEADTYEEKFQVLNEIQDDITDRLIDDIAVVLDVVIPEGELNDRFRQLRNIILTRQKYEIKRLRF